jgi:hypothetical protein
MITMRAFLLGIVAAAVIAVGAAFVLNSGYLPNSASSVFSTTGVRI